MRRLVVLVLVFEPTYFVSYVGYLVQPITVLTAALEASNAVVVECKQVTSTGRVVQALVGSRNQGAPFKLPGFVDIHLIPETQVFVNRCLKRFHLAVCHSFSSFLRQNYCLLVNFDRR